MVRHITSERTSGRDRPACIGATGIALIAIGSSILRAAEGPSLSGQAAAAPASSTRAAFDFFDDFSDGLWTKHAANPVMTRTEPWETRAICEPSVLYENGLFKMWYMGSRTSTGYNAALGYATSPDGLAWTKHPDNPILSEPNEAVIRTTVIKHRGIYYLFASDHQWTPETGVINRWTSRDGLRWTGKTTILRPSEPWEKHFHNVGVVVDDNGIWHMLYTTDGPFGYAHSRDGLNWTKHKEPVIQGFYGGDPYLTKIGETFYAWHSREHKGHLRIYCAASPDMIRWRQVGDHPQIGYSQPWERGIGRSEVWWDRHLADAELLEHNGKVLMYYGGAQCPFGLAVFDGSFARLAQRMERPPLMQWAPSHYASVDGGSLRIADSQTEAEPIRPRDFSFDGRERRALTFRLRCDAAYRTERVPVDEGGGASGFRCHPSTDRCAHVIVRYADADNYARCRAESGDRVEYEEKTAGTWSKPVVVGQAPACDGRWHEWTITLDGAENCVEVDGRVVGTVSSSSAFVNRTGLRFGFSVRDTFVSLDDVRMTRRLAPEPRAGIVPREPVRR